MSIPSFASTPEPPYYAVIFSSQRTDGDRGYAHMADRMIELAAQQPGYLGVETVRDATGFGITVSYWTSLDAISGWKQHLDHQAAQKKRTYADATRPSPSRSRSSTSRSRIFRPCASVR
jgi:heme-degrading monooxygenase HmoA